VLADVAAEVVIPHIQLIRIAREVRGITGVRVAAALTAAQLVPTGAAAEVVNLHLPVRSKVLPRVVIIGYL